MSARRRRTDVNILRDRDGNLHRFGYQDTITGDLSDYVWVDYEIRDVVDSALEPSRFSMVCTSDELARSYGTTPDKVREFVYKHYSKSRSQLDTNDALAQTAAYQPKQEALETFDGQYPTHQPRMVPIGFSELPPRSEETMGSDSSKPNFDAVAPESEMSTESFDPTKSLEPPEVKDLDVNYALDREFISPAEEFVDKELTRLSYVVLAFVLGVTFSWLFFSC